MITIFIIAAEIAFWIFILLGLVARYIFKRKKLSLWLFSVTPLIDLLLLVFTVMDLGNGAGASFVHALAAIYIGVSIAFGKQMIHWADIQFQYYFLKIDNRPVKLFGTARGKKEFGGFLKHLMAYIIGASIIMGMHVWLRGSTDTGQLINTLRVWSLILGIDFLIALSYVVFPKKEEGKSRY